MTTTSTRRDPDLAALEDGHSTAELARSHARLRVLAAVSHEFAAVATDYGLLLETIARTTADLVGDGCMVTLVDTETGTLRNAASAHRDRELEIDYREYLAGIDVPKMTSASVSALVARTGQPKLVHDVEPAAVVAQNDEPLRPLVARLNVHSFVVVPVRARQTIIGTLSLLRSSAGRGYTADDLVLLEDLADRAGLAIDNARLYQDLERKVSQRTAELKTANEELEAFSYSVAHDLRAPLRSIDGFSMVLLEDNAAQLDDDGKRYLAQIREAAHRMGALIDDLLGLARAARVDLKRERVDLSALARLIADRLQASAPERTVGWTIAPGLVARADRGLLEVVLTNLLGNAWKYSGKRDDARIEVGVRAGDRPTVFFVRDNGAGFEPTYARKLFTPFHRLHGADEFEGAGIGLAIVHRIIQRHGGRIWADGQVDRGATFYFTLEAGDR